MSLLLVLVSRAGEVISNRELIALVWPQTVVGEANLRVHVAGLRRALRDGQNGHRFIVNIPGRGYRFVAPVEFVPSEPVPALPIPPVREMAAPQLPSAAPRLFGRDTVVTLLSEQVPQHRFVTLVGPGGIGKTVVALAVARKLAETYRDGVIFVDFSAIRDPVLVPNTIFARVGLTTTSPDIWPALLAALTRRATLLVLDNCEHVIEVVASMAERIFGAAPDVHILCTSREPLRAVGERVHRLQPLEVPQNSPGLTAAEALEYACIQLFVDRVAASLHGFTLSDVDAPMAAEVCRRLDGIALAIELAASRAAAFGVGELAKRLDDRFRLLTSGRRTALPRHQTLLATLDWSFDLLPTPEQDLLCRLAIFAGDFSLAVALAVAGHADPSITVNYLGDLVAKSLIAADVREAEVRYRLLDTTRLYGLQKLRSRGQLLDTARRHAEFLLDEIGTAAPTMRAWQITDRSTLPARSIDDVRAALSWAFSAAGDKPIGIALTAAFAPVWIHLSFMSECQENVERALLALGDSDLADREVIYQEMLLLSVLGSVLLYKSRAETRTYAVWTKVLDRAERLGDIEYSLLGLWGMWVGCIDVGEFRQSLRLAEKFCGLAERGFDPAASLVGQRMMGSSLHLLGDQHAARWHLENVLRRYDARIHQSGTIQLDPHIRARTRLAVVLWLQGFPQRAMQAVEQSVTDALAAGHEATLASVLAQGACSVALACGDLVAASRFTTMLLDVSERNELRFLQTLGRCYQGMLLVRQGEFDRGLRQLRTEMNQPEVAGHGIWFTSFLCYLAEAYGLAGDVASGLATIDEALERSNRLEEVWCRAGLLHLKGKLALQRGLPEDADLAETLLRQSLELAMKQGALSWELRAATSLARLWRDKGRTTEGRNLLSSAYQRVSEGFSTTDVLAAKTLLEDLRHEAS